MASTSSFLFSGVVSVMTSKSSSVTAIVESNHMTGFADEEDICVRVLQNICAENSRLVFGFPGALCRKFKICDLHEASLYGAFRKGLLSQKKIIV